MRRSWVLLTLCLLAMPAVVHAQKAAALASRFTDAEIGILEKLNRADREHLAQQATFVVPERWLEDERDYSPLPRRYAAAAAHARLLIVHLPAQVFGAYESGELVRWGPISSGAENAATPPGLYHLNWNARGHASSVNPDWFMQWYFNFDNARGLAFHEYALPGLPASHGCVRLLQRDAQWLFGWGAEWRLDASGTIVVEPGTPVLIVGAYDFAAPPAWRSSRRVSETVSLPSAIPER